MPSVYRATKIVAIAQNCIIGQKLQSEQQDQDLVKYLDGYQDAWAKKRKNGTTVPPEYAEAELQKKIDAAKPNPEKVEAFKVAYDAAWKKLDDDLFNTARLYVTDPTTTSLFWLTSVLCFSITCGMYINVSIHDYLRALMGMHQHDTTFTLDPRVAINKNGQRDAVARGIGNQVTTEFNLLYRFHCAISQRDEDFTEKFMKQSMGPAFAGDGNTWDPKTLTVQQFMAVARATASRHAEPWETEFGLPRVDDPIARAKLTQDDIDLTFERNKHSGLFDDEKMIKELKNAMDAPIGKFP